MKKKASTAALNIRVPTELKECLELQANAASKRLGFEISLSQYIVKKVLWPAVMVTTKPGLSKPEKK